MVIVPQHLAVTTRLLHGAAGDGWLARLPASVAACEERWGVTALAPFTDLSYNYVAPATLHDGTAAVLKACFPDASVQREAAALRHFDGRGAARLLAADVDAGLLLLERLEPGFPLSAVEDDVAATSAAAQMMRHLWRPAPPGHLFPSVRDWAADIGKLRAMFNGRTGPLPARLVEEAESLCAALLPSQAAPVLLHGDLHHGNILAAGRAPWLAIDPKGVVGEPAYETGALLRNPDGLLSAPEPGRILARRVDQLSDELGLDRARVRGWGLAQAVLAAVWSLEDHGEVRGRWLRCAELLAAIRE